MFDFFNQGFSTFEGGSPLRSLILACYLVYPFFSLPVIVFLWKKESSSRWNGLFSRPTLVRLNSKEEEGRSDKALGKTELEVSKSKTPSCIPMKASRSGFDGKEEKSSLIEAARTLALATETSADLRAAALDFLIRRGPRGERVCKRKSLSASSSVFSESPSNSF